MASPSGIICISPVTNDQAHDTPEYFKNAIVVLLVKCLFKSFPLFYRDKI